MAMGEKNFFKFWPKLTAEEKFQRHAEQLDGLWQGIPDETLLGFHWCYGTWGGWPMTAMDDLALCVRMSNEAKRRTGRRLDYVHMPVVRQSGGELLRAARRARRRRHEGLPRHRPPHGRRSRTSAGAVTSRGVHLPSFGIGSVCGYGRIDPGELSHALRVHAQDAKEL